MRHHFILNGHNQFMDEREAMRRKEIEKIDVHEELAVLEDVFNYAIRAVPPEPTSGLVEMQRWFAKLRR